MRKLKGLNEINTNVMFIFPILAGFLTGNFVYGSMAVLVLISSSAFHYLKFQKWALSYLDYFRSFDVTIARTSYVYMFYFIYKNFDAKLSILLYFALLTTIIIFYIGNTQIGKKYSVHSYFHLYIGLVSGAIPLFTL